MRRIQLGVLVLHLLACSGFPTYDYDEGIIRTALNASLARLNNESRGKNLYRITRSNVRRVVYPGNGDVDADITLEFNVRETTCNKNSARDPTTCNFKIGHSVEASCRSQVLISDDRTQVVSAYCSAPMDSSSESDSSEEKKFWRNSKPFRGNYKKDSERFPSRWDPYGRMNQKPNPRWEEDPEDFLGWE